MYPQLAISTLSLGSCDHHSLPDKLSAAANAGFTAIDLFDADWEHFKASYAKSHDLPPSTIDGDDSSVAAARAINRLCTALNLRLLCLQPFREFEARLNPAEAADRMRRAKGTLDILPVLGTSMLLIPSTTLPASQLDPTPLRAAADLGALADYAASFTPPLRICYEALSWGTNVSTWRAAWDIVSLANRPNLGLCLDSFNTAAREWADPYSTTGVRNPSSDRILATSLASLKQIVPSHKIFYFQLADGQRMLIPLTPPTDPSIPPLRPWSRSYRLFPLEKERGAYLPVKEFADAVKCTGYDGPWCLEIFNDSLADPRREVPDEHARRGWESLHRVIAAVGVKAVEPDTKPLARLSVAPKQKPKTLKTLYRFLFALPIASLLILLANTFFPIMANPSPSPSFFSSVFRF